LPKISEFAIIIKENTVFMKTIKSILISLLFIPIVAFAHEPVALPKALFILLIRSAKLCGNFLPLTRMPKRISRLILPQNGLPRLRLFWKQKA